MRHEETHVEDEIDTSPLLHHLERSTKNRPAEIAVRLPKRSFEAIGPGAEVTARRDDL